MDTDIVNVHNDDVFYTSGNTFSRVFSDLWETLVSKYAYPPSEAERRQHQQATADITGGVSSSCTIGDAWQSPSDRPSPDQRPLGYIIESPPMLSYHIWNAHGVRCVPICLKQVEGSQQEAPTCAVSKFRGPATFGSYGYINDR